MIERCDEMGHVFIEKAYQSLGCALHYWVSNNNSKEWIVFLHGLGCNNRMFKEQIKTIPTNYNILLWDERGHGKSRPLGQHLSFDLIIDDILNIIDIENCKEAIFVGHSQGGQIAQEVAYRYPNKVKKLILIGSNCNTKKPSILEKIGFILNGKLYKYYPWTSLIKHNRKLCSNNEKFRKYAEDCYKIIGERDFKEILITSQNAFHYEKDYRINKPILFLYGEYDKTLYTKEGLKYWRKYEKKCECHMIYNAAHNANQDNPNLTNDLIIQFLKNCI